MRVKKISEKAKRLLRLNRIRAEKILSQQETSSESSEIDEPNLPTIRCSQEAGPSNVSVPIQTRPPDFLRQLVQDTSSDDTIIEQPTAEPRPVFHESFSDEELPQANTVREGANFGLIIENNTSFHEDDLNESFNLPRVPDPLYAPAVELYPSIWVDIAKNFDKTFANIQWKKCNLCEQEFPDLYLLAGSCSFCKNKTSTGLFNDDNLMFPGEVPEILQDLTPIEEMLIAKIHPVICLYRIRGQQYAYSGHVIHFRQDVVQLHSKLPVNPISLQSMVIITRTTPSGLSNLRVRSSVVRSALEWLKANHLYYQDIEIDSDILNSLPLDGDLDFANFGSLHEHETDAVIDEEPDCNIDEYNYPQIPQLNQADAISAILEPRIDWPRVHNVPISEFTTEGYLSQAFPSLFPFGKADLNQPRLKKVDYLHYFQYLMRHHSQRFAKHPRFRFVAFDSIMRWQAIKAGTVFISRNSFRNVTAEGLSEQIANNPGLLNKIMYSVGKLRASQSFWSTRCGELLDMVQQLGTPSIFFTLSSADYHWPDLFRLLCRNRDLSTITEKERAKLMHDNPLIVSWFFRRRAETFIDKVLKRIFTVKDFWYRYEWQWRGSPHIHGVMWLENAPDIESLDSMSELARDELAGQLGSYCQAWNPAPSLPAGSTHPSRYTFSERCNDPADLADLLNCLQRHTRCGRHCIRTDRKTGRDKCRYGFPKPLSHQDKLIKENELWTFKPKRNDEKMARYNRFITQVWRGNIDFSPITSKDAVINYIAKYASKCEKTSNVHKKTIRDIVTASTSDTAAKTIINKVMISSTAERDFSAQETCHLMMGWPLYHSSRAIVNLVIRDDTWIRLIHSSDADSKIITRYAGRPSFLADLNLFTYAQRYKYSQGAMIENKKFSVIRVFPRLKLSEDENENEKYFKLNATVYIPWTGTVESLIQGVLSDRPWQLVCRNLPEFLPTNIEFPVPEDIFEEELPADPARIHRNVEEGVSRAAPVQNERRPLGQRVIDETYDWTQYQVDEVTCENLKKWLESVKPNFQRQQITNTNEFPLSNDQQRVLDICLEQIRQLSSRNPRVTTKRVMVQGKAGSGKSFLISKIASLFQENFGSNSIEILAPTGVAAVNIGGRTIHSFLNIGVGKFSNLEGEALRNFQLKMSKIKALIFDEMSMIGLQFLAKISKRLQEGRGSSDEPFGGYIVYFLGDMQQLPPVNDYAMYSETEGALSHEGRLVLESFQRFMLLTTCHRQSGSDQESFRNLLDGVSNGEISDDAYNLLMSRRIASLPNDELRNFENSMNILTTIDGVMRCNYDFIEKTGNPCPNIVAEHSAPQAISADEDKAQGLSSVLNLSIGCRVMLRINLWTERGLVNGSVGTVREFCYRQNEAPPSLPVAILIEFDGYSGPYYKDNLVPITPIKRYWQKNSNSYWRKQFPLSLAHAITAHKAQGLTLDKVKVNIGEREFSLGLTYVILSRVKSIQGLVLLDVFAKDRINALSKQNMMKFRRSFLRRFN